jgi:hypothetical protein
VQYTPARHFAKGKNDLAFRTKLQIRRGSYDPGPGRGVRVRAVCAHSADRAPGRGFRGELAEAGLPFVVALKPRRGTWAYGSDAHTPVDAARAGLVCHLSTTWRATEQVGKAVQNRGCVPRNAPE